MTKAQTAAVVLKVNSKWKPSCVPCDKTMEDAVSQICCVYLCVYVHGTGDRKQKIVCVGFPFFLVQLKLIVALNCPVFILEHLSDNCIFICRCCSARPALFCQKAEVLISFQSCRKFFLQSCFYTSRDSFF